MGLIVYIHINISSQYDSNFPITFNLFKIKIESRKRKVYFLEICMTAKLYVSYFYLTLLSLIVKATYRILHKMQFIIDRLSIFVSYPINVILFLISCI